MIAVHFQPRRVTELDPLPRVTEPNRPAHLRPTVEIRLAADLVLVIHGPDEAEAIESAARVAAAQLRLTQKAHDEEATRV